MGKKKNAKHAEHQHVFFTEIAGRKANSSPAQTHRQCSSICLYQLWIWTRFSLQLLPVEIRLDTALKGVYKPEASQSLENLISAAKENLMSMILW